MASLSTPLSAQRDGGADGELSSLRVGGADGGRRGDKDDGGGWARGGEGVGTRRSKAGNIFLILLQHQVSVGRHVFVCYFVLKL